MDGPAALRLSIYFHKRKSFIEVAKGIVVWISLENFLAQNAVTVFDFLNSIQMRIMFINCI